MRCEVVGPRLEGGYSIEASSNLSTPGLATQRIVFFLPSGFGPVFGPKINDPTLEILIDDVRSWYDKSGRTSGE